MSPAAFVAAVDRSFLPKRDKARFRRMALDNLDRNAWKELNARLIEELVRRESMQRQLTGKIDEEINKFTADYEKEKSVIDREFRDTLAKADESAKDGLWEGYRATIRSLQGRLLKQVEAESTTVLHDVVLLTSEDGTEHT